MLWLKIFFTIFYAIFPIVIFLYWKAVEENGTSLIAFMVSIASAVAIAAIWLN